MNKLMQVCLAACLLVVAATARAQCPDAGTETGPESLEITGASADLGRTPETLGIGVPYRFRVSREYVLALYYWKIDYVWLDPQPYLVRSTTAAVARPELNGKLLYGTFATSFRYGDKDAFELRLETAVD